MPTNRHIPSAPHPWFLWFPWFLFPLSSYACTTPTGTAGDVFFNTTYKVMQYCNGSQWVNTGAAIPTATNTGCTTPSGPAGAVFYNSPTGVVQFCNGQHWVDTACAATRNPNGSGCTTPSAPAGTLFYETTRNELQYCDSTHWVAMGWPCASGNSLIATTILTSAAGISSTYIVPAGATELHIIAWGAGGGGMAYSSWNPRYPGGGGGFSEGRLAVVEGEYLTLRIGKGGTVNGAVPDTSVHRAGDPTGTSGGGFTGVFRGVTPMIIAGGGGAGGTATGSEVGTVGGGGGGLTGQTVTNNGVTSSGGTQSAGGVGGGGPANYPNSGSYLKSSGTAWVSGGSGYYGGAGSSASFGSGGSGYIGGVANGNTIGATDHNAAQNTHPDYMAGRAMGGNASAGGDGMLVVRAYGPAGASPSLNNYVSCLDALQKGAASSGVYTIHPVGTSGMQAYCDMTTDGGGWTLVLNYLHQAGNTQPGNVRTTNLPLQGGTTLGTNESGTAYWGHAAPSLMAHLPFSTLRFQCKTNLHARVMHFKTNHAPTIAYFTTGTGGTNGMQGSFTPLAGHTANLPATSGGGYTNYGDNAMTVFPFYTAASYHWGLATPDSRWECDDYSGNSGNTHHQIWVR